MLEVHRTHRANILNHSQSQVEEMLDQHGHGWSASKLWNVAKYHSREVWNQAGEIPDPDPDHGDLKDELKTHNEYNRLHSKSSQRVLEELAEAFNSWDGSDDDRDNLPGYRKRNYSGIEAKAHPVTRVDEPDSWESIHARSHV
jgi:Probable transposase.